MNWETNLSPSQAGFMQDIIDQVPELARDVFVDILRRIAEPTKEVQRRLDKLQALENGGVDNWEWYDQSLEDWRDEEDEGEEE